MLPPTDVNNSKSFGEPTGRRRSLANERVDAARTAAVTMRNQVQLTLFGSNGEWWWISPTISPLHSPLLPLDGQHPAHFPPQGHYMETIPAQYEFCASLQTANVPQHFPSHGLQ